MAKNRFYQRYKEMNDSEDDDEDEPSNTIS